MATNFLTSSVLAAALLAQALQTPAPSLATARARYASAAYEEALTLLASLPATADATAVAELRALCFLGLGREDAAHSALEGLVRLNPGYQMNEALVSPRLVALFDDVRRQVLPETLRELLMKARAAYQAERFREAAAHLDVVLVGVAAATDGLGASLVEIELAAKSLRELVDDRAAEAQPYSDTFSMDDRDVKTPIEISRVMPRWTPGPSVPHGLYQGLLEVVIDTRGRVVFAEMRRSVHPSYDAKLLAETERWRFEPAIKDNQPVRYRRFFEVILHTRRGSVIR